MVWHNSQGVLKCRKCAQVFVLKGALERHEDYCIKRVMFRCDICNKVYKGQKDLADHMRKIHGQVKGFNYWKSVNLQHNQGHDYDDAVTLSEAQVPSKIEGINLDDKTTKHEGNVDNVGEFVKEMNSILLTQKNKKKLSQTKDVYRCTKCDFATEDKRKYNSHRGHHNYIIHKQRSAEPQSYTCDKCEKEYKTTLALKSHTKKVHTGTVIFECPQKGCFKNFTNQQKLKDHLLEYEESGLFKCAKCAKSFVTKHNLKEHEDSCTPKRIVPCDTAENSGEINAGDDEDGDDDRIDEDEDTDHDDNDDIEGIVKTLNKAINKKRVQRKVFQCKRCNFSAKDKKYYSKHLDHHIYLDRKQRTSVSVPQMYICSYCGLTFRSKSGLSRHELNYHSNHFFKCKVESCRSVYKDKQQLKEHMLKHKQSGFLKCTKCDKKFVYKSRLTRHEDSCIRNMTTYEQAQCHICRKQFLSKASLIVHMRQHKDGMLNCFCGKIFDSKTHLNKHKKCHNDIMLNSYCKKDISQDNEDISNLDEKEDSTSLSSSAKLYTSQSTKAKQKVSNNGNVECLVEPGNITDFHNLTSIQQEVSSNSDDNCGMTSENDDDIESDGSKESDMTSGSEEDPNIDSE
ncbi:KRAB [Mytilus coruscus]|uniref:KRAB n=1 Tax=Mytilus coruscus TaxID=42192 RepID=A0A6J8DDB4_MYTCO|nr:KRAB [Mytilus coruscus]